MGRLLCLLITGVMATAAVGQSVFAPPTEFPGYTLPDPIDSVWTLDGLTQEEYFERGLQARRQRGEDGTDYSWYLRAELSGEGEYRYIYPPALYSRARIWFDDIRQLAALGIEVDHGYHKEYTWIENDFSAEEIALARQNGFRVDILIHDVQRYYYDQNADWRAAGSPAKWPQTSQQRDADGCVSDPYRSAIDPVNWELGSYSGYFTYQEMLDNLDSMASKYPELISLRAPIGPSLTHEGRPVYYVRISDNADTDETGEPEVLYTAIHHAREPGSMATLIYYMWFVLENYGVRSEVTYLVDNTEMYFIPCINPDGYIYNETTDPSGGGLWRKNRRNNGDGTRGVDLNRNYSFLWGYDNIGSSPTTSSNVYRGPSPASEPEIAMVESFSAMHEFRVALNYHTHGDLLIYPWGYEPGLFTPDSALFVQIAQRMTAGSGYVYGTGDQTVGYVVNGDSDDWQYGEQVLKPKTLSMTPEVGDGFWSSASNITGFGRENLRMNALAAFASLRYGELTDVGPDYLADRMGSLDLNFRRYGLEDGGTYTINAEVLTGNATGPTSISLADPDFDVDIPLSLDYDIDASVLTGDLVQFALSVTVDGSAVVWSDTIDKFFGASAIEFAEEGGDAGNWHPLTDWGSTTEAYVSETESWTDSPFGNYEPSENNTLTLADPIDLSDALSAQLRFEARWAIEARYDYAQVLVSTDGSTWIPQCGRFTILGSQYQDEGQPLYSGDQLGWVSERIDLTDYVGADQLWIQFRVVSDYAVNKDGFYFDDLVIDVLREEESTAINEIPLLQGSISPNPASDFVQVNFNDVLTEVQATVTNLEGKVVWTGQLNGNSLQLDVSDWPAGVYHLRAVSGEQQSVRRFAVTR